MSSYAQLTYIIRPDLRHAKRESDRRSPKFGRSAPRPFGTATQHPTGTCHCVLAYRRAVRRERATCGCDDPTGRCAGVSARYPILGRGSFDHPCLFRFASRSLASLHSCLTLPIVTLPIERSGHGPPFTRRHHARFAGHCWSCPARCRELRRSQYFKRLSAYGYRSEPDRLSARVGRRLRPANAEYVHCARPPCCLRVSAHADLLYRNVAAGAEPFAVETAASYPQLDNIYPLVVPAPLNGEKEFQINRYWGNLSPKVSLKLCFVSLSTCTTDTVTPAIRSSRSTRPSTVYRKRRQSSPTTARSRSSSPTSVTAPATRRRVQHRRRLLRSCTTQRRLDSTRPSTSPSSILGDTSLALNC